MILIDICSKSMMSVLSAFAHIVWEGFVHQIICESSCIDLFGHKKSEG